MAGCPVSIFAPLASRDVFLGFHSFDLFARSACHCFYGRICFRILCLLVVHVEAKCLEVTVRVIFMTLVNRTGILAEMLSCEPQANPTVFEGLQQDSGYTTKPNEGLGFTSDENAVTVTGALKDSESTEIEKAIPENQNENTFRHFTLSMMKLHRLE